MSHSAFMNLPARFLFSCVCRTFQWDANTLIPEVAEATNVIRKRSALLYVSRRLIIHLYS